MKVFAKIVLFLSIVIVFVAAFAAWESFRAGYSARGKKPSRVEAYLTRHARHMLTPSSAVEMKNPFPATPQRLDEGRAHWMEHCAQCHGLDGSGNSEMGPNLYPPAPDMRLAATQDLSDGELFYIIQNGVMFSGMPGWGGEHSAEETWHLVLFIRHLPQLTPDELKEMQQAAPKEDKENEHHNEHHD